MKILDILAPDAIIPALKATTKADTLQELAGRLATLHPEIDGARLVQVLLDPTSSAYLRGTSIDFDDGLQGKGFEIRNPNAQSTCGCGKSFN